MDTKYGLGVFGWLLVMAIAVLLVVDDLYTWEQQGTITGVEFFLVGVVALVVVVVGLRSMRAHRPPPRH